MDSLPQVAPGDDGIGLSRPITTLLALLDATRTHAGIPAETRRCLDEMAACVLNLSVTVARMEAAADAAAKGRGRQGSGLGAAELRGWGLREFVGADSLDQLGQRPGPFGAGPSLQPQSQSRASRPRLTPQEQRILDLIAEGCTNRQIAGELFLAEKTVKNYVSNMLRKLGMQRRTQAAVYAAHLSAPLAARSGTVA